MWILILEIIIGLVAYFIMKGQLKKVYDVSFIKRVRWMLIVPIVQVLVFAPLGYLSTHSSEVVEMVDKLGRISTYAPFFGEDVSNLVDIAIENDVIDDTVMQNSNMGELVISAGLSQIIGFVGIILFLIMIFIQFRGIFGSMKEKLVKKANVVVTITILVVGLSFAWVMTCVNKSVSFSDEGARYLGFIWMLILACVLIPFTLKFNRAVTLYYAHKEIENKSERQTVQASNNGGNSKVEQLKELKNLYMEAMALFRKGDYEAALAILVKSGERLSPKEKQLAEVCKKSITDKYYYIIKESIEHGDISNASKKKAEYERFFNFDSKIANLEIHKSKVGKNNIKTNAFGKFFSSKSGISITVIVLACIISLIIWIVRKNDNTDNIQNRDVNTIVVDSIVVDSTACDTQVYDSALVEEKEIPDNFEFKEIKERKENFEADIQWPMSMSGIDDISDLQKTIIKKVFNSNYNNIEHCIEDFFEGCTEGKVEIRFLQGLNDLYVFKAHLFADMGGGAGAAILSNRMYIYYDKNLKRALDINDITDNYTAMLDIVNRRISSSEQYDSEADELPDNFILSDSGITFIFPAYSIGAGYLGQPEIYFGYDELSDVLTDSFKNSIGL